MWWSLTHDRHSKPYRDKRPIWLAYDFPQAPAGRHEDINVDGDWMATSCKRGDKRPRDRAFQPQSLKTSDQPDREVTFGVRTSSYGGAGRVG